MCLCVWHGSGMGGQAVCVCVCDGRIVSRTIEEAEPKVPTLAVWIKMSVPSWFSMGGV